MKVLFFACLVSLCSIFVSPGLGMAIDDCTQFVVELDIQGATGGVVVQKCIHGSVVCGGDFSVTLEQSLGYGPDCHVTFYFNGKTSVYRVRQDLCGLEAGEIKVDYVSGVELTYKKRRGSFADSRPGHIYFTHE